MNPSEYFQPGDMVYARFTAQAYPYEREPHQYSESSDLGYQARVVFADAAGICLIDAGASPISAEVGHEYVELDRSTGTFHPWPALTGVTLYQRSVTYERSWDALNTAEEAYAAAHDGQYPKTPRELWDWKRSQVVGAVA